MPRLDGSSLKVCNAGMQEEVFKITVVPFARTRRTMLAAPSGELGNQRVYRKCVFHAVENTALINLHKIAVDGQRTRVYIRSYE